MRSSSHKNAAAAAAAAAARAAVAQAGSQSEPELGAPEKSNNVPDAIASEVNAEQGNTGGVDCRMNVNIVNITH